MQVAPRSRQITMPTPHHSVFLQAGCPSCRPNNSVKALKARTMKIHGLIIRILMSCHCLVSVYIAMCLCVNSSHWTLASHFTRPRNFFTVIVMPSSLFHHSTRSALVSFTVFTLMTHYYRQLLLALLCSCSYLAEIICETRVVELKQVFTGLELGYDLVFGSWCWT